MVQKTGIQPGDIISEEDLLPNIDIDIEYLQWLQSIDVILLLGGGVPLSPAAPPVFVQRRCDAVAKIIHHHTIVKNEKKVHDGESDLKVICLSAGTAHLPQFILPHTGLPLWESTASAAYLIHHPTYPVPPNNVLVETSSYDTISNAFFARTVMTDVMKQDCKCDRYANITRSSSDAQRVLVVTNEFHIHRSKAIFDWIFHAPSNLQQKQKQQNQNYEMFYLSCNNIGLSDEAIHARKAHEMRGEMNVRTKLSVQYKTLHDVWTFLTKEHDFYSAKKLVERAMMKNNSSTNASCGPGITSHQFSTEAEGVLKLSYGKTSTSYSSTPTNESKEEGITTTTFSTSVEYRNGKVILTLDKSSLLIVILALFLYSHGYKSFSN